jgi:3-oxoacyl-[acyl-carrier protein] reductase
VEEGGNALAIRVDLFDGEPVEAAVGGVATELGAPTALVNNAAVTPDNLVFQNDRN